MGTVHHISPIATRVSRITSVRALGAPGSDGRTPAEDMHGIPCFIDNRTQLDVAAKPCAGQIFEASIDPKGWIVAARLVGQNAMS